MIDGIYAFWKPKGPTSHRFLNDIRRIVPPDVKVGHAGTLDPLAEGVLIVGIGRGTKMLEAEVSEEKEYIAEVTLGISSSTDDEEGEKTIYPDHPIPETSSVSAAAESFVGEINQIPPAYSAIKIGGKEAYKFARKGIDLKMKPRPVKIISVKILEYDYPRLILKVTTGKGVYIRSLARDIGLSLGTGGYLSGLKRTRVGKYNEGSTFSVSDFKKAFESGTLNRNGS